MVLEEHCAKQANEIALLNRLVGSCVISQHTSLWVVFFLYINNFDLYRFNNTKLNVSVPWQMKKPGRVKFVVLRA